MGLDNIPREYPCVLKGTVIKNDIDQIDCEQTQKSGGCPYKNERESDPMLKDTIPVYGMFGTDCWYRGKYGNYLLGEMYSFNEEFPYDSSTFYGDMDGEEEGISPNHCLAVSETMKDYIEEWVRYVQTQSDVKDDPENQQRLINDWIYASWWLKFVGENANGSAVWY